MHLRVDGDNHKNELVLFLQRRDQAGPGGRWLVSDFIVSEEDGTCGAAARARGATMAVPRPAPWRPFQAVGALDRTPEERSKANDGAAGATMERHF
jgi:hypothetical protein